MGLFVRNLQQFFAACTLSSAIAIAVAVDADVARIIDGDDDDDFVIIMKARRLPQGAREASTGANFRDQIAEVLMPLEESRKCEPETDSLTLTLFELQPYFSKDSTYSVKTRVRL